MSTSVRAAVFTGVGAPPRIEEVALPDPGAGHVRVRLAAAGVCHSDLSLANGTLPQAMPAVLGHEGAGTVEEVGPGVTGVAPGDRVVLNWAPPCRSCWFCANDEPWLCEHAMDGALRPYAALADGTLVHAGLGTAAFAEATVVPVGALVPLPDGVDPAAAALLGCAVLTGWGAVVNSAGVRTGESVAVVGLGGVGLATLQGARLAGADPIVAIDVSPAKEELALASGATHFVASGGDGRAAAKRVRELTGGRGADHAFEVVGASAAVRTAWDATRRGGTTTVVGVGAKDDVVGFSALELFHFARTLRGCVYGAADPARDVPVLAGHVRDGRIDLSSMVTDEIGLDDVPAAFERMREGRGGRSLIRFG
jgi:S-(hydroxymethyl)glutathione dehydrogenase/alcohol dehydrogenase